MYDCYVRISILTKRGNIILKHIPSLLTIFPLFIPFIICGNQQLLSFGNSSDGIPLQDRMLTRQRSQWRYALQDLLTFLDVSLSPLQASFALVSHKRWLIGIVCQYPVLDGFFVLDHGSAKRPQGVFHRIRPMGQIRCERPQHDRSYWYRPVHRLGPLLFPPYIQQWFSLLLVFFEMLLRLPRSIRLQMLRVPS